MILSTGWTVAQLEATPWPDVVDLLRYMRKNPPTYLLTKWANFETKDEGHIPTLEELENALKGIF